MNSTLNLIANSGLNLEFLCLPSREDEDDPFPREQLINISSTLGSLKSLNCSSLVCDDNELSDFVKISKNTEDLDMSWSAPYLTNEGFENASKWFHKLRRINVSFINQLSDAWLVSLSMHCPPLEEVICISQSRIAVITEGGMCQLIRRCSRLRRAVFGEVYFNMYHFPLAQAVFEAKCLRYLEINYVVMVDKNHEGEGTSAAQIKDVFLDKWEEEHGRSYFFR